MKKYRTIQAVYLYTGKIGLNEIQALPRIESGHIKVTDEGGVYDIAGEVCFRVGEDIGLEEPGLAMLKKLECLDVDQEIKVESVDYKKQGRPRK